MKHSFEARIDALSIQPLKQSDIELLRKWRNDEHIAKFFRKIGFISAQQQLQWYNKYLIEKEYYWSIVENGKTIGALAIYNISDTDAEIGRIMIGDINARGKGYGYKALIMAMTIGFQQLNLKKFNLNVHEKNTTALNIYKLAGFIENGSHPFNEDGKEYEMCINYEHFVNVNPIHKNVVVNDFSQ